MPDVPAEVRAFFESEYPGITDVSGNIARIRDCGYEVLGHFRLPDESWWTDYYTPLAANLERMREKYRLDPAALRFIAESEGEQQLRRDYPDAYGYEFFVTRLIDPDAPRG